MFEKSFKQFLRYVLQLLLLTTFVVTVINIIMLFAHKGFYPFMPFGSYFAVWLTSLAMFTSWYVLYIPAILICVLLFTAFLAILKKGDVAPTILQYYLFFDILIGLASGYQIHFYYCVILITLLMLYRKKM